MHAHITAYKGRLIFELKTKHAIKNEVLTTLDKSSVIGQIIINTKKNLGISKEALALLKKIGKTKEHIGEIDWSKNHTGQDTFIWSGRAQDIKRPEDMLASKTYKIMAHTIIENMVPQGAMQAIDLIEKKFQC